MRSSKPKSAMMGLKQKARKLAIQQTLPQNELLIALRQAKKIAIQLRAQPVYNNTRRALAHCIDKSNSRL